MYKMDFDHTHPPTTSLQLPPGLPKRSPSHLYALLVFLINNQLSTISAVHPHMGHGHPLSLGSQQLPSSSARGRTSEPAPTLTMPEILVV